ncbi:dephospho-CoA kinase [Rheinheimera salexigens]|uniref:Dephospho-CoA kinase n=1 Tax=Rheinheimera salexigens TaxID=1628148 RepID=A0A1E7Q460_9GAMM|nr:dephospho-CoA kinase [Rheinheimera salexigens]OEY68911.1 dephospho-CoA kinase [Rheinheimera salexigens]
MSQYIVGLTGGIGCGKTTVTNLFSDLGVQHVDADVIARDVVKPGTACLAAIAEQFGPSMLLADGSLNRPALRQHIFTDATAKTWLEQLLHPAIRQQLLTYLAACSSDYVLLVAPLLLENNLQLYCHRVLVIDLPEALQLSRTLARDQVSEQQVAAIMAAQLSREDRLAQADDVIVNDSTLEQLLPQVQLLHKRYLQLAAAAKNMTSDNS